MSEAQTETAGTIAADGSIRVRRALISVSDKTGLADFGRGLAALGVEILSTGGTAAALREAGVEVTDSGHQVEAAAAIENIDIGGPTMIRAAAKNHEGVAVVVKPESYDALLAELEESDGAVSESTRHWLANEAFAQTARYDAAISRWFSTSYEDFPEHLAIAFEKVLDLSYGENPHQRAALYSDAGARSHILSRVS